MSHVGDHLRAKIRNAQAQAKSWHAKADGAAREALNHPMGSARRQKAEAEESTYRQKARDFEHAASLYQGTLDTLGE